jgi:hypothetical protein
LPLRDLGNSPRRWLAYPEIMKAVLLTIAIVLAYAAWTIFIPNNNQGFDKSWDCPPIGRGGVVCIKKP